MFVLTLVPAYPSPPTCVPSLLAPIQPPDAALNYSECEKIRKIRPSVLPCISVPPSPSPLSLSHYSIVAEKLAERREQTHFSSITATGVNARRFRRRINRWVEINPRVFASRNRRITAS